MRFGTYAGLLRVPAILQILLLSFLCRTPVWASSVVITLHVVGQLHRSYAMAGLVTAVQAAMLGISGPFRGRRLDQVGLRRALTPSLVVLLACWSVAPWVGYWPFLVLVAVAGLFTVPTFAIARSVMIGNTSPQQRTAALSIDGILTDLTFMVGPILGVLLATTIPTSVALFVCQLASVAGAAAIWWADPALGPATPPESQAPSPGRRRALPAWLGPAAVAALAVAASATFVLVAEDLATIAAMRHWLVPGAAGWMLALWGGGSLVGGLVYGSLHRHGSAAGLLVLLAASSLVVAVAPNRPVFAVLLTLSGGLSAPTITATAAELSRVVPTANRTESMGWHGSATTVGNALGAPAVGIAMDATGWKGGFLVGGLAGLLVAPVCVALARTAGPSERGRSSADSAMAG